MNKTDKILVLIHKFESKQKHFLNNCWLNRFPKERYNNIK